MAKQHTATLLMSEFVTHDVKRFIISRPAQFSFEPGQGVELAINQGQWANEPRPFTPTSLNDDQVLEFIIKRYPAHDGVTDKLHSLPPGAELSLSEPFGAIRYAGPGVFVAGGAGITPFVAILRERARQGDLAKQTLLFSNKTPSDTICEKELRQYFGDRGIFVSTATKAPGFAHTRIDKEFLAKNIQQFDQHFYVCGPPAFTESINNALADLGAEPQQLVFER